MKGLFRHLMPCLLFAGITGCGNNKFEKELERENVAVGFWREVTAGDYGVLSTEELRTKITEESDMVLVDAMPETSYRKAHIPGAGNFPFPMEEMSDWDEERTGGRSTEDYEELLGDDKARPVVVYCGYVKCARSHNAALWARKLGYENVRRHPGGIYAWKGAGYRTESASEE